MMRPHAALTALLLMCGCAVGPDLPDVPQRADLSLDLAVEPVYGKLLENPLDPVANGNLANVLHRLGQYPEAELLYRRAYLLDPSSFRWPYYIAHTQALAGNHDLAVSNLRQALALESDYVPARLALGRAAFRAGDMITSTEAFEGIEGNGPAGAVASYWLGRIALERRDWEGEVARLSEAVEMFPEYGVAQYALGIRYKQMSREPEARRHLGLAQEFRLSAPRVDDPLLRTVFGDSYDPMDYVLEGRKLLSQARPAEALPAFQMALRLDPDTVDAHVGLIECYGRMGRAADAGSRFREAIAADEGYDQIHVSYGAVLLSQNRFQEAAQQFARALDLDPYNIEALVAAGYLEEQDGSYTEAIRNYRRALEYRPDYPQAHLRLGNALLRLHRDSEARSEFTLALENPGSSAPRLLYRIGQVYARSGSSSTAEDYFKRATQSAAENGISDTDWREEADSWPLD